MDRQIAPEEDRLKIYIASLDPHIFRVSHIPNFSLLPLTTGHQNHNYVIQLDGQQKKKFVLRYNPHPFDENEKTESEYQKLVLLNGLHAPKVLFLGQPEFLPSAVLVMEFIEGEHKEFFKLKDDEIQRLARAVVDIHSITKEKFSISPGAPAEKEGAQYDYLQEMIANTITKRLEHADPSVFAKDKDVIDEAKERLKSITLRYKDAFSGKEFSLLHLDIIPPNVLWHEDKITFVDWIALSFGDRAEEVAYIFAINNLGEHFQQVFLDEYQKLVSDKVLLERVKVYMLKHKLFDLAWSITMLSDEKAGKITLQEGSYQSFYDERLTSLKDYLNKK
jgi:aminoglycoside phosphotransferase (APT) family kinase protein